MKKLLSCLFGMLFVLTVANIAFSELINFDDIVIPEGQDQLYFLDEVFHGVRFSSPDYYDPNNPMYGWIAVNRGSALTCGVSSLENSIFSGYEARGRIKIEFPQLVNFVQITGGDAGNLPDSFAIEAYDSEGNLLSTVDTGLFSGNSDYPPPGLGYYVDQATLSISVPDIKYVYVFATTPTVPTGEGGVSFDDLVYEFQDPPPAPELFANAGEDMTITVDELETTTIYGTATYTGDHPLHYRWLYGEIIFLDWTPVGNNNECFLPYNGAAIPPGAYELTLQVTDGQLTSSDSMILTVEDSPPPVPVADAGENISIYSEDVTGIVYGTATYTGDNPLQYRWLWEETILLDWTPAGSNNECTLVTDNTTIPPGTYVLTLEVSDGQATSSDSMILTVLNSAPHAAILGGAGTYQIGSDVILSAEASDFDGDTLTFSWEEGSGVISTGSVQSILGGTPVMLPDCTVSELDIGTHYLTLEVYDGVNDTVTIDIIVEVIDTQEPTLSPVLSTGILWPPNHQMMDITIQANAFDNSGLPVTLSASVISNEPVEGLGDGDMFPDWTGLVIDQDTGVITFQLRSERSGTGDGREYTVIITATDTSGNSTSVEKIVIVPHDKSKK